VLDIQGLIINKTLFVGITSTIVTYPFDIMRTQFAMQGSEVVYKSMGSFISHTYQAKGVPGFYAGLTPAVVGITPYMGLNFALYESFKKLGNGKESPVNETVGSSSSSIAPSKSANAGILGVIVSMLKKAVYGGAAGGLSKFTVYPLDTVKKRLQAQVLKNTMSQGVVTPAFQYRGILHCFQSIYVHEGVKGFYRGIAPTTAKSIIATSLTFAAYEGVQDLMAFQRRSKVPSDDN